MKRNAPRHQVGPLHVGVEGGFHRGRGGRFAPRRALAARRPRPWPEIWAALDVLADAYELAGGDVADGLIAEQRVSRRLAGRDD